MYWMCIAPEGAGVRGFVNCSARYRMEVSGSSVPTGRLSSSTRRASTVSAPDTFSLVLHR
jgi:hypothetical protein